MPPNDSGSGGGFPLNFAALLALLTVVGGVLVASRQLTTERPGVPSGLAAPSRGEQSYEARLWEDPFSPWMPENLGKMPTPSHRDPKSIANIRSQIAVRKNVVILPVMVPGQSYSEDRELRTRSRFSIVSALGQAGYAPEQAGHLGIATIPWPSTERLNGIASPSSYTSLSAPPTQDRVSRPPENTKGGAQETPGSGEQTPKAPPKEESQSLGDSENVTFEWYRKRSFHPNSGNSSLSPHVLVIWVSDGSFIVSPLLRLAVFLHHLTSNLEPRPPVELIGPMSSDVLRAMVGGESAPKPMVRNPSPEVSKWVKNTLSNCTLYLATPNSMDEVLLPLAPPGGLPRESVVAQLKNSGFKNIRNFAAIDSQLASEIFDELKLRNIPLEDPQNHLVMISEWDSFYGRMLSLTYAAELSVRQHKTTTRREYVMRFGNNDKAVIPSNLASFVFERGLDGQTMGGKSAGDDAKHSSRQQDDKKISLSALKSPNSDGTKAEGPAQFDYLSRLGGKIQELDTSLRRQGKGRVNAIGIVGGDTYDTLLILQALRPRFPNAVYFTTELDARFWNADQWEWSHNLIVCSGYGLQLHPDLQRAIPPFRSSMQTAQYAAALAALGESSLAGITVIPPRRFEIGRSGPVDLSTTPGGILHPKPTSSMGIASSMMGYLLPVILASACILGLGILAFRPLRFLTVDWKQAVGGSLWLRQEDIGGLEGFERIRERLHSDPKDPVASWLVERARDRNLSALDQTPIKPSTADRINGNGLERMQEFLDFLNTELREHKWQDHKVWSEDKAPAKCDIFNDLPPAPDDHATSRPFVRKLGLDSLLYNRTIADRVLAHLLKPPSDSTAKAPKSKGLGLVSETSQTARSVGIEGYHERRGQIWLLWLGLGLFLVISLALLTACLKDNFSHAAGEPLSFSSGTSAWPAIWLRLLALFLSWGFIVHAYSTLRTAAIDITRSYRLPWQSDRISCSLCLPTTPIPLSSVDAGTQWTAYLKMGRWVNRICRIVPMMLIYLAFGMSLSRFGDQPLSPVRGLLATHWNTIILFAAVLSFLFLTFGIMDACRLCRWLIERLTEAPTRYPEATRSHFRRMRGGLEQSAILDEWLDLQLIAELTERVGRMIYYPFIVFFLMLLARNNWWDQWPWSLPLIVIFAINLSIAVGSAVILQRSALRAREIGLKCLNEKLQQLRGASAKTPAQKEEHDIKQAEELVDEIRKLNTGAFCTLWKNPILGALLVPSGGTAAVELITYLMGR